MRKFNISAIITPLVPVVVITGLLLTGLAFRAGSSHPVLAKAEDNGPKCTEHSARGTYGFALLGTITGAGVVSTSGTTTFDGEGRDSGKFAITTLDQARQFTFSGRYTVNADCTGTATLEMNPPVFGYNTVHFNAVATDNLKEIKWLITDFGIVLAGTLTKQ